MKNSRYREFPVPVCHTLEGILEASIERIQEDSIEWTQEASIEVDKQTSTAGGACARFSACLSPIASWRLTGVDLVALVQQRSSVAGGEEVIKSKSGNLLASHSHLVAHCRCGSCGSTGQAREP